MPQTILWVVFGLVVTVMLVIDLGIFQRRAHAVKVKEALIWSGVWISLALLFDLSILLLEGSERALLFLTGYLTEKSLSVDNLFVFFVIFSYFGVPAKNQHKVLFWGILGALMMRGVFIAVGLTIIERLHWSIYVFGAFLVFTGIRLASNKEFKFQPERNPMIRFIRRFVPFLLEYREDHFFTRRNGHRVATLLLFVLVVIETTDVMFAVDSVPAVLAITTDPLLVYTSNIFAILGLRALFFAIAGIIERLHYLNYGLSVILVFLGVKMMGSDFFSIPSTASLGVIAGVLAVAIVASLLKMRREGKEEEKQD